MDLSAIKDYLGQFKKQGEQIQKNLERIYELRESINCIGNPCSEEWVQHARDADRVSALVSAIVDLEKETDELIDAYTDKKAEIRQVLDNVCTDNEGNVVNELYFSRKTVSETALILGLSNRHVKRLHQNALLKVAEKIKNTKYCG